MKNDLIVKREELRKTRYALGLSLLEVSRATGVSANTICMMECGKVKPLPKTLKKLCDCYGIDPRTVIA